ncbi:hypothetical protein ElyMa_005682400 [Elysia marginata]|uniref:CARMIL C-terminal domain-containing protein n=1 Tax=Elysia marginata TaxID=1093978 RepID=A0AAV4FGN8_9GAST|nr:hypothetical protein ElyMa_005682400 [Elysia marginata]
MLVSSLMGGDMGATRPLLRAPLDEEFEERPGTPNIVISQDPGLDVAFRKSRSKSIINDNRHIDASGLRNLLNAGRRDSKMVLTRYDRNLTSQHGGGIEISDIQRRKTSRNRRLQRLFSVVGSGAASPSGASPVQKRKSWCEVESESAVERHKHPQGPRHAATVDLGTGVGRMGTVDPIEQSSLAKHLDSVFEEDEEKGKRALPGSEGEEGEGDTPGLKHHKSVLKRQVGMDRSTPSPMSERSKSMSREESQGPKLNMQEEAEGSMPLTDIKERTEADDQPDKDSRV